MSVDTEIDPFLEYLKTISNLKLVAERVFWDKNGFIRRLRQVDDEMHRRQVIEEDARAKKEKPYDR